MLCLRSINQICKTSSYRNFFFTIQTVNLTLIVCLKGTYYAKYLLLQRWMLITNMTKYQVNICTTKSNN